jgi:DeoR/GlpR family transcriptional regulator of sugar metabolism
MSIKGPTLGAGRAVISAASFHSPIIGMWPASKIGQAAASSFMGVTGVHPDAGLTTGDADEAAMKRALASRAAETYVLASAEKIGTASPYQVIPLDQASAIITDAPPESVTVQELRARQVEVITTSVPS